MVGAAQAAQATQAHQVAVAVAVAALLGLGHPKVARPVPLSAH